MPEFDIDSLKKDWQEQNTPQKYESSEIQNMLNRKSRNYVKYILWISLIEFVLVLSMSLWNLIWPVKDHSFLHLLERLGVNNTEVLKTNYTRIYFTLNTISLLITAGFVICFYINYTKIKVEENFKAFNLKIIHFRKSVNLFILLNIALLVVFIAVLTTFIFLALQSQDIRLGPSEHWVLLFGILIASLGCLFLVWLYYRTVYGLLMKRLKKNLKQLSEIEKNT
ncbi:beta-carotene 15,15'-monooxygenase [Bergeyella sp. RCAD1439]|uniref:beta-carotene 15,15'-monooxygenase n=1 Tax=Bergeyella anatis TaxID=3113737 RepID=UPI002E196DDB|nr:beta-carotene 15,15'-monooxygenase [Bergeyella sp. RCAD1439]